MVNLVSAVNVWGPLFITCGVHVARVLALDAELSPGARTLSSATSEWPDRPGAPESSQSSPGQKDSNCINQRERELAKS